jgi:hypothetical protein
MCLSGDESDCAQVLLSLICYELRGNRISPEMELILENHLLGCPSCRKAVRNSISLTGDSKAQNLNRSRISWCLGMPFVG